MSFRPPKPLREEFERIAKAEGISYTDALISLMHDWVKKKQRERGEA
ncbi:hypothetical protein [Streptomyces nigrescens]